MKFTSSPHPELIVHDLGVIFHEGEAEVADKATIDALRGLPCELGVRVAGGRPTTRPGA
ncbi:hypothetical protein [Kutzneria sp. NPDC051319]|uniref:hypothetical protein n=1 Tax=Kutzneria sp. NPDC051319 TaxID=3155047 RepID=UPI0034153A9D